MFTKYKSHHIYIDLKFIYKHWTKRENHLNIGSLAAPQFPS